MRAKLYKSGVAHESFLRRSNGWYDQGPDPNFMKSTDQEIIRSLGSPWTEDWWNSEAGHEPLILEDQTVLAIFDGKTGA